MSMGYCAYMNLVAEDNTRLMYTYCSYDLNHPDWKKQREMADGEITIARDALVEPEIHRKNKKMPSGRKKFVEKRIVRDVAWNDILDNGKISIKNASGTWQITETGNDFLAIKLLFRMFDEYQKTGEIPKHVSLYS